jgi:ParB-like chromosome segregation protein Spo0J
MSDDRHVSEIIVGLRHRKDMGDIEALAASVREVGLLHPIVIRPDGTLIAGARRLAAVQQLDWRHVPVRVVDIDSIALGEAAENLQRKDFTPSELVAIGAAVEERERELAKARQLAGKPLPESFGKDRHDNETSSRVAAPLGISGRTYDKAKAIIQAASDNEEFAPLVEEMDRTGKVNGAFKKLRQLQGERHHGIASDAKSAPVYSDAQLKHKAKPDLDVFAEKLATKITNIFSGQLGEQIRAVVNEREHLSGKSCGELSVALTTVECAARRWCEQLDGDTGTTIDSGTVAPEGSGAAPRLMSSVTTSST